MTAPEVLFDISRLATRFSRVAPNGIDRADLAYAQHFLSAERGGRGVLLATPRPRCIDNHRARAVAEAVARHWRETAAPMEDPAYAALKVRLNGGSPQSQKARPIPDWSRVRSSLTALAAGGRLIGRDGLWPGRNLDEWAPPGARYVNVSQFPLWLGWYFRWLDRRPDIKAVFFVHDLLPVELPELFPPAEFRRHSSRLEVLTRLAAGVIVASEETRATLVDHWRRSGCRVLPVCLAPLPPSPHFVERAEPDRELERHSYFVAVGTIEPRKNHLFLLQVWRELSEQLGEQTPKLVLVGVRGWENENVLDMLERSDRLRPFVIEAGGLSTPALRRVLGGARALLMPSVAEGYGLPLIEARAVGVQAIVSGIPSLQAIDSSGVIRLDAMDGPAWLHEIGQLSNAANRSALRRSTDRDSGDATWALHFGHVESFIDSL